MSKRFANSIVTAAAVAALSCLASERAMTVGPLGPSGRMGPKTASPNTESQGEALKATKSAPPSARTPRTSDGKVDFSGIWGPDRKFIYDINDALKKSAEGKMTGFLAYCDEPLVSSDFRGNPASSIVDGLSTVVLEGKMAKVLSWYDNEWGYSCRVGDLAKLMVDKGL